MGKKNQLKMGWTYANELICQRLGSTHLQLLQIRIGFISLHAMGVHEMSDVET